MSQHLARMVHSGPRKSYQKNTNVKISQMKRTKGMQMNEIAVLQSITARCCSRGGDSVMWILRMWEDVGGQDIGETLERVQNDTRETWSLFLESVRGIDNNIYLFHSSLSLRLLVYS